MPMRKCNKCGKDFEPAQPMHTTCPDCHGKGQSPAPPKPGGNYSAPRPQTGYSGPPKSSGYPASQGGYSGAGNSSDFPRECVFSDFYGEDGFLVRGIFIESAADAARTFSDAGMTQTSVRKLFNMLKQAQMRLRFERGNPGAFGKARQIFYEFARQVEYQRGRDIVKPVFHQFVSKHTDLATSDQRQFIGFVEYFTSIMARLRQK